MREAEKVRLTLEVRPPSHVIRARRNPRVTIQAVDDEDPILVAHFRFSRRVGARGG